MDQTNILIRPIITEKSMHEATNGRFTFAVVKYATKPQVKIAIEEQFKVNVLSMQTLIAKGKRARLGKRRIEMSLTPYKKVIARLKNGQRIDLFDVQGEATKNTEGGKK